MYTFRLGLSDCAVLTLGHANHCCRNLTKLSFPAISTQNHHTERHYPLKRTGFRGQHNRILILPWAAKYLALAELPRAQRDMPHGLQGF